MARNSQTDSMAPDDPAALQDLPQTVVAFAADYPDGHVIKPHRHPRAQLVFAQRGVIVLQLGARTLVVPPARAVWVPAGEVHALRMRGAVRMRTLYVREGVGADLPRNARVLSVTPLIRELIGALMIAPRVHAPDGPASRLAAVLLDQIRLLPADPLHLPMPEDRRLRRIAAALLANPADRRTINDWAESVGAGARTLARLFPAETGMTFGAWRRQARLLAALERLASGEAVTLTALDVGYESPGAFIKTFRRTFGVTPARYFTDQRTAGRR